MIPESISIAAFDSALNVTGYAAIDYSTVTKKIKLVRYGVIKIDKLDDDTDQTRLVRILDEVKPLLNSLQGSKLLTIETPPQTFYGDKFQSPNVLIGRLVKIFPVVATASAIAGLAYQQQIPFRLILPQQWQLKKSQRKIADVKAWSVASANKTLSVLRPGYRKLTTKDDVNTADAINIAVTTVRKIQSGEWSYAVQ